MYFIYKKYNLIFNLLASSITCLILDSNSHLYFVQATNNVKSKASIFLFFIEKGTLASDIACANHSTTAVFHTQGSQINAGLFFVFLFNIAISLFISFSLQITFSNFQLLACLSNYYTE